VFLQARASRAVRRERVCRERVAERACCERVPRARVRERVAERVRCERVDERLAEGLGWLSATAAWPPAVDRRRSEAADCDAGAVP
jgi:hypothetical protein